LAPARLRGLRSQAIGVLAVNSQRIVFEHAGQSENLVDLAQVIPVLSRMTMPICGLQRPPAFIRFVDYE